MIHDFATAPRQDWRQPKPVAPQKAKTSNTSEKRDCKQRGSFGRMLVPVLGAAALVFGAQAMVASSEPALDQQPDAAAKREYAESMLVTEDAGSEASGPQNDETVAVATLSGKEDVSQMPKANKDGDAALTGKSASLLIKAVPVEKNAPAAEGHSAPAAVVADIQVDPDYGFYDSLKQGSWPVPINKGVYVDGELAERERPVYKLQAASFRNSSDAYRLAGKLKQQRLSAVVVPSVSTNGQYWYQVSVGPFVSTTKMNKAQDILVSMNMMPLKKRVQ